MVSCYSYFRVCDVEIRAINRELGVNLGISGLYMPSVEKKTETATLCSNVDT